MHTRRPLSAILLLFAVLHGSVAVPLEAPPDVVPPADMGMAHHGHDGMTDSAANGHPAGHSGPDCCEPATCDCGCTATPATAARPVATAHDWRRAAIPRAENAGDFYPGTTGAPFRPPA